MRNPIHCTVWLPDDCDSASIDWFEDTELRFSAASPKVLQSCSTLEQLDKSPGGDYPHGLAASLAAESEYGKHSTDKAGWNE